MKYFTGIDVSLRFVSICVVDEAGVVRYENKVAAEVDVIVASLRGSASRSSRSDSKPAPSRST